MASGWPMKTASVSTRSNSSFERWAEGEVVAGDVFAWLSSIARTPGKFSEQGEMSSFLTLPWATGLGRRPARSSPLSGGRSSMNIASPATWSAAESWAMSLPTIGFMVRSGRARILRECFRPVQGGSRWSRGRRADGGDLRAGSARPASSKSSRVAVLPRRSLPRRREHGRRWGRRRRRRCGHRRLIPLRHGHPDGGRRSWRCRGPCGGKPYRA